MTNRQLAAHARQLADEAPAGSLARRAAACVAVALATTKTLASARSALTDVRLPDVHQAAVELLGQLETTPEPEELPDPNNHAPERTP